MQSSQRQAWVVLVALSLGIAACSKAPEAPVPVTNKVAEKPAALPQAKFGRMPETELAKESVKGGTCNFETVQGKPFAAEAVRLRTDSAVVIEGWAYAPSSTLQKDRTYLILESAASAASAKTFALPISMNVNRGDVATYLKLPVSANLGFKVTASLNGVEAGQYYLRVRMDRDDKAVICGSSREVELED